MGVCTRIIKLSLFLVPVIILLLGSMTSLWYVAEESLDTNWKKQLATTLRNLASWLEESTDVIEKEQVPECQPNAEVVWIGKDFTCKCKPQYLSVGKFCIEDERAPECQPNAEFIGIGNNRTCTCKQGFLPAGNYCIADNCYPGMNKTKMLRNATCVTNPSGEGHIILCNRGYVVRGNETSCTVAPSGWSMGASGVYYKIPNAGGNRNQSVRTCYQFGGNLLRIKDYKTAKEIYSLVVDTGFYHVDAELNHWGELVYNNGKPARAGISTLGNSRSWANVCLFLYKNSGVIVFKVDSCSQAAAMVCQIGNVL